MSLTFGSPVDEFLGVANTGADSIIFPAWKYIIFSDLIGELARAVLRLPGDIEIV